MTREEAARILRINKPVIKRTSISARRYVEAFDMAISALSENKGEWIPVSERLPETHQDVLLELRSGEILTGFKAKAEPYFYCHGMVGCYVEPQNVLAWQPLPEPYKAESEVKPNDRDKH